MVETKDNVPAPAGRAHQTRVVIDAPIEEVWKAITEADAIARWFAPKMTVQPGVGGFMIYDWGLGVEWKTAIEVWEPNRHLRLAEAREQVLSPESEPLAPCRLLQDYYLETSEGRTVLRLVHSGFGSSEAWDREYEGTRGGWAACFIRLKLGLERHRHDPVRNVFFTTTCEGITYQEALERIETVIPRPFEVARRDKYELVAILPQQNGSLLTASAQSTPNGAVLYLELLLFTSDADPVRQEWQSKLRDLFPASTHAAS
jgi:uncharacterized protein YndB with AHSA1/START domain